VSKRILVIEDQEDNRQILRGAVRVTAHQIRLPPLTSIESDRLGKGRPKEIVVELNKTGHFIPSAININSRVHLGMSVT